MVYSDIICSQNSHFHENDPEIETLFLLERLANPVIINGRIIDIHLHDIVNATPEQKQFIINSLNLKLQVIESEQFKKAILSGRFKETNNMSNLQVYNHLMSGWDAYHRSVDHDMDLLIRLYKGDPKVIGSTTVGRLGINTNKYHIDNWMKETYGMAKYAGHSWHEYAHAGGFYHRGVKKKSFVYMSGYIVRELAIDVINGRALTPVTRIKNPEFALIGGDKYKIITDW